MTDATVADRTDISGSTLAELVGAFGLGEVRELRYLADGLMNVNWRVDTPAGAFALKRVTDVPLARLIRNLGVLGALAEDGIPVSAPVTTNTDSVVAEIDGGIWCLFPWAAGAHGRGVDLSLTQVASLGAHLGRLHVSLGQLCAQGLLPAVPDTVSVDVTSPERAVERSHRLSMAAEAGGSAFDVAAAAALDHRRTLIAEHADLQPQHAVPEGAHGWTHGDVQYRNLLWEGEELVAVLDWNRVGVRPYAEEVVRTAQVQFGVDGVFDLARVSAFVGGYRSVMPLEDYALADGVRRLWMLQTRVGKRTAEAAFAIAAQLADERLITTDEALARVDGDGLARLMFPAFDTSAAGAALAHGLPASPGAAVGAAVFDSAEAVRRAAVGEKVILVRQETTPDDLPGMIAAQAVLISRGGKTSHAAVVARGMGKVCVCGAEELTVEDRRFTTRGGVVVEEGTVISVDGSAGAVYPGAVPLADSAVMRFLEGGGERSAGVVDAVARALEHADGVRRLEVRANADTPEDAARARRFGAQGIGLCRTEHMFLGERRKLVEEMILARDETERERALAALLPLQRADFTGILEAMDGLPVTIRLLDPPLHEFLPDRTELAVRVASAAEPAPHDVELLEAVNRMHEENPMLGLRGVRLGLVIPGLVAMQVRAVAEAVVARVRAGGSPQAEIMVPLVGAVEELRIERAEVERVLAEVSEESGVPVRCPVGTMIELPRAALTAGRIAGEAEFFSFGTNDLTQTTWGFSRDDVEAAFFSTYLDKSVFPASPFETLDRDGVGRLVRIAVDEGRAARPGLKIGVCGEHGGDPDSVHFFHTTGLDYVSCSPFRVPVARLEAGRAALAKAEGSDSR